MWRKLMMVTGGVIVGILAGEAALRVTGFAYDFNLRTIGYRDGLKPVNITDPQLLWVRQDYHRILDSLHCQPPALISLGCSCTYGGEYQRHLERLILQRTGRRLAYGNVATVGWSSHQGLTQLRRDIWRLHPKIITVFFGWNDHWRGFGVEDKRVSAFNDIFFRYRGIRLMQLLTKSWVASINRNKRTLRVSQDDFRRNLTQMVDFAKENGMVPVLVTAPTPRRIGDEAPASPGTAKEWDGAWLHLHREYASIVREVSAERNVCLCDAAAEFDSLPAQISRTLFPWDDIHFDPRGAELIAEIIYRELQRAGLLDALG